MTIALRAAIAIAPLTALVACVPTPSVPVCVGFSAPLVPGTTFGAAAGNAPGDLAFAQSGISVYLDNFLQVNGNTAFGSAKIDTPAVMSAAPPSFRFNNIAARFDFTNLAFVPSAVKLVYADFGGSEVIAVNGSAQTAGDLPTFSGASIGGGTVTVTQAASTVSSKSGTVEVAGGIKDLTLGGQELWIDEVCAIP